MLAETRRLADAKRHLTTALKLDPGKEAALVALARTAELLGDREEVERLLQQAAEPPAAFEPPAPLFGPPAPPSAPRDPAAKRTRRAVPWQEPERDPFRQALVDFGEYAQGATEALGKDVGKAYGALWDLGFRALQQVGVAGDRESARPWRDAAVGVVERSTEILSGAIADAATFGVTSSGPLTQRAEEIVDERTRNRDEVGLDEAGLIALDTFNVFNPVNHLRIAAQKAIEAHAAGDDEEVGKRYTDAVVAAAQIVAIGKGVVETTRSPGSARDVARQRGRTLLAEYKAEGTGQGAGRSGGHGTPHKRAGAELIREGNKLPRNDPLHEALKTEGDRLIKQGKAYNHR